MSIHVQPKSRTPQNEPGIRPEFLQSASRTMMHHKTDEESGMRSSIWTDYLTVHTIQIVP